LYAQKKGIDMKKITIIMEQFTADHYYEGIVREGGNSARVNVPKTLIGKKVIIIVIPKGIEGKGKEGDQTPKPLPSIPEAKTS
jgi:putative transposon-encoded protein